MAYLVLARKYRPQSFKDVLGQEHVTRTLENAIKTNHIAHAYLFSGPRGVGKTTTARIFAKALNCEKGLVTEPCQTCSACKEITAGTSMDVIEIDGGSTRGINEIRELRNNVRFAPASVRYKVYIIDEVHQITSFGFNALLKTLEEPPAHVKFMMATTEPHELPRTIISRLQHFTLKLVP
ncbi:MAG: DNA polymerase III subunit gamma/tau, partial [Elusimicrobiota bacterium]